MFQEVLARLLACHLWVFKMHNYRLKGSRKAYLVFQEVLARLVACHL